MTQTILQVYEDNSGRLLFRTDLPASLPGEEKAHIIGMVQLAMMTDLRGFKEMAVNSAIRQLGFGAILCEEDLHQAKEAFRSEANMFIPVIKRVNEEMQRKGFMKPDPADNLT